MTEAYAPSSALAVVESESRGPLAGVRVGVIAAVAVIAVLVAVASYFAGRAARPGSDARARVSIVAEEPGQEAAPQPLAPVSPTAPVAARPVAPADAEPNAAEVEPGPFETFDLRLLHPDIATAVVEARQVRRQAEVAAEQGRAAAQRSRTDAPGTRVISYENGDVYEGEVGDAGRQGVGVYIWANPREGDYAGEFSEDAMDGLGVKRWADGATYYGDRRREARDGFGVFVYAEGGGYEGEWRNGAPDGHGVVWTADGAVRAQGLWSGNTLVEAWIVPAPEDGASAAAEDAEP